MSGRERELRRMAMRGVPERLGLRLMRGDLEMRAKPDGTAAGSSFEFTGYAAVYDAPFQMWDPLGEPYTESVAQGACRRSLANPNLDVPFLIGHQESGIPLARTRSGTMRLAEDSHGLHVRVPSMDGRREEVRALASAVERGDISEMSLAFVCNQQQWDDAFEHRTVAEMDLHRGDVCAVTHGANAATDGISMFPVEQLAFRRPAAIGAAFVPGRERRLPTAPYTRGAHETAVCPQCQSGNDLDARYCDQCGTGLRTSVPYLADSGDTQQCRCGAWNAPDAKICDQCGQALVDDHDADDGYPSSAVTGWAAGRPLELRAAHGAFTGTHSHAHPAYGSQGGDSSHEHEHAHDGDASHSHAHEGRAAGRPAERRMLTAGEKSAFTSDIGNSSRNSASELSAALHRLVEWGGSGAYPQGTSHGDLAWMYAQICAELQKRDPHSTAGGNFPAEQHQAGRPGVERRCPALVKILGSVRDRTQPEAKAAGRPLESRASAADDVDLAAAQDYDGSAAPHPMAVAHAHADGTVHSHGVPQHDHGTGAMVTVDDSTGIPGPETQMSAGRRMELRLRELELEELAAAR